jgi:hypothetical protein
LKTGLAAVRRFALLNSLHDCTSRPFLAIDAGVTTTTHTDDTLACFLVNWGQARLSAWYCFETIQLAVRSATAVCVTASREKIAKQGLTALGVSEAILLRIVQHPIKTTSDCRLYRPLVSLSNSR